MKILEEDIIIIRYLFEDTTLNKKSSSKKYSYICNPDKTIRWLFPKSLKSPMFLNFYSTSSLRAKVLSAFIKLAFFMKLPNLVKSGDINLHTSENSRLGKVLSDYPNSGFSIFTGTIGENRKAVIEIHNKKKVNAFVKIALTEAAKTLVNNEAKCLKHLNKFKYKSLVTPLLLSDNHIDTIRLSNIKPKVFQQSSTLTDLHVEALSELYTQSIKKERWANLYNLQDSKAKIADLLEGFKVVNDLNKSRVQELTTKILLLIDILEEKNEELTVARSHGDFTPWNMYHSKNILYLFDWELSENDTPLLYDTIHFIFQSQIMIKHTNYKSILNEINKLRQLKSTQKLIKNYNVNFNKNYIYYLVHNVTYYLNKYIKQKDLHEQVFWMIDVWEEAINDLIKKKGNILYEK